VVKANGLDLTLFQFDYDLTFSVFFMNADKTIYGRYGTRSSVQEATKDISISGLAAAMMATLAIHEGYPANRDSLKGKQSVATQFKTPDDFPSLKGQFAASLDYPGAVTKSCMHCHQIRDAERQMYRDSSDSVPDRLLYPNPLPQTVGLDFDPKHCGTVAEVAPGSLAESAGFQKGDELLKLGDQPIISLADVQWVLHQAQDSDALTASIRRNGAPVALTLALPDGWRKHTDISWRVSSWPLRRMGTGGLLLESATDEQRREAKIDDDKLALFVKHVGQYGPHAAAKKAGFEESDMVVSFDGHDERWSESQLLAYAAQHTIPGQQVSVVVLRKGNRKTLSLPMQN
jgi:hypothetical protein